MMLRRFAAAGAVALCLLLVLLWASDRSFADVRAVALCADGYPSIQAAINAADDGDSVRVPAGYYAETLVITESITLQGGWDSECTARVTTDPAQTVIDANQAGSVARITGGSPTLEGLTITGGWANRGGGLYIESASPTLAYLIVTGNTVSTTVYEKVYGAGLYLNSAGVTLDHVDVISNIAQAYLDSTASGAGIYMSSQGETAVLVATRIMSNAGAAGTDLRGAGINLTYGRIVTRGGDGSIVAHNAGTYGGGIYMYGDTSVWGLSIVSNTAAGYGGGVFLTQEGGGSIANTLIAGNSAHTRGAGVHVDRVVFELANNTLVGNEGGVGSGIDIGEVGTLGLTLTNNIIAGHKTGILNRNTTVSPTLRTNDLWDNDVNYEGVLTGTTDIHVDPQFVDGSGGDYHLAAGSPLIDAGTPIDWLTIDFDGDPRPIGTSYDIGADEWGRFTFIPLVLRAY